MPTPLPTLIHAIAAGAKRARNLTRDEALTLARAMVSGEATWPQIAAIFVALRVKGETAEELAGLTEGLKEGIVGNAREPLWALSSAQGAPPACDVDLHGDGHQGRMTTSLAAAAIAVASGVRVLLRTHLRSRHTHVHFAEVARGMGVTAARDVRHAAATIATGAPALLDLATYHPYLADLLDLRDQLGIRTAAHTIVKLLDPANLRSHVVGIFHAPFHDPVARALDMLGAERALVVRAPGGLPEPAPDKLTPVGVQSRGNAPRLIDVPALALYDVPSLDGGPLSTSEDPLASAHASVEVIERLARGPFRHATLVTAATYLVASGVEADFEPAIVRARAALDSGAAARALTRWRAASA